MKKPAVLTGACSVVALVAAAFVGVVSVQAEAAVYPACGPDEARILAGALPEAGVLDQDKCPIAGREIVDHGVGAAVPAPGERVFAEAMSPEGHESLEISNPVGDALVVEEVGSEANGVDGEPVFGPLAARGACRDSHNNRWPSRLSNYLRWSFNVGSVPAGMSRSGAARAVRSAGTNVSAVQDGCGVPDRVPAVLKYQGGTGRSVDMDTNGNCGNNDHKSVVGFGDLASNLTGSACIWTWIQRGPDRINSSDVRLNKDDYKWTTRVTPSCRGRWDVESTMTHERGHTFGLGDVSESSHPSLTMSVETNGPCQTSERSLGRGDAVGLNGKYR